MFSDDARKLSDDSAETYRPSVFLLSCFAIETALKAYILHKSGSVSLLYKLNHNLEACLRVAREQGLDISNLRYYEADLERVLSEVQVAHKGNYFRYMPNVRELTLPTTSNMLALTKAIVSAVRSQTNIESSIP